MPLTDTFLRAIKTPVKVEKHSDGGGMYLYCTPAGGKHWRFDYRFEGKRKTLSFGPYPAMPLKDARKLRDDAKERLAAGIDPSEEKKAVKAEKQAQQALLHNTFQNVALDWYAKRTVHLSEKYRKQILARLEGLVFPYMGSIPISQLEPADILNALRHSEARGILETTRRQVWVISQVCRYARLQGLCKFDPAAGLTDALQPVKQKHHAAITAPKEIGILLGAIDAYWGDISTQYALRLLPYVFLRSSELRGARWAEIDFTAATWTIPAERMKRSREHVIPLCRQALALLEAMKGHSGHCELVFPSPMSKTRCISDVALLNALRRMGYTKEQMTVHGFRTLASTRLNEMGFRGDIIESQLAHAEKDATRKAYNRAEYMQERREMLQQWADYLVHLKGI